MKPETEELASEMVGVLYQTIEALVLVQSWNKKKLDMRVKNLSCLPAFPPLH
jgi:hypothetical protein